MSYQYLGVQGGHTSHVCIADVRTIDTVHVCLPAAHSVTSLIGYDVSRKQCHAYEDLLESQFKEEVITTGTGVHAQSNFEYRRTIVTSRVNESHLRGRG